MRPSLGNLPADQRDNGGKHAPHPAPLPPLRYAASDALRINRLLRELKGIDDRRAHFSAALCIASETNEVLLEVEGRCEGLITHAARGEKGFGYDPIFEVDATGTTFAEMTIEQKRQWSHRGCAFALLDPALQELLHKQNKP